MGSLAEVVSTMLTEPVTRSLPRSWQDSYSPARARRWISEHDAEGSTLLASQKATGLAAGLVILFESPPIGSDAADLRLVYLLAEPYWGMGLATELVEGLAAWCRGATRDRITRGRCRA